MGGESKTIIRVRPVIFLGIHIILYIPLLVFSSYSPSFLYSNLFVLVFFILLCFIPFIYYKFNNTIKFNYTTCSIVTLYFLIYSIFILSIINPNVDYILMSLCNLIVIICSYSLFKYIYNSINTFLKKEHMIIFIFVVCMLLINRNIVLVLFKELTQYINILFFFILVAI